MILNRLEIKMVHNGPEGLRYDITGEFDTGETRTMNHITHVPLSAEPSKLEQFGAIYHALHYAMTAHSGIGELMEKPV